MARTESSAGQPVPAAPAMRRPVDGPSGDGGGRGEDHANDGGEQPVTPVTDEADQDPPGGRVRPRWSDRRGRWRRGWVLAVLAVALAAVMVLHSKVPNAIGHLGSLLQTFLPWVGLAVPVLLAGALLRRSATALVALALPVAVWGSHFGGLLLDKTSEGGALMVVSHNVDADNPDPAGTAAQLAETGADLLALQEIPEQQQELYRENLAETYPHHSVQGTVGLWSRYPLSEERAVDIGMGWPRAMRATVTTADGARLAAYVAHLPSVRVEFRSGFTAGQRDGAADRLAHAIAAEQLDRVVLLGDLNGTMNDRALAPVTSQLRSTQGAAGAGFGFSFPASFPVTRIDQILVRGLEPVSSWTLPATDSDHLPVAARLDP